jgi:hypothetical protein
MAGTTTNPKPVVTHPRRTPTASFSGLVDRTSVLSDELLTSLKTGERAAIESLGQFFVTIEEALPQEVAGTSEVAKKVTESGLEMADGLIHTQYAFLRKAIHSTAKALRTGFRRGAAVPGESRGWDT